MSFSDRIGKTNPKTLLQVEAIDADLRNGLWQACIEYYLKPFYDDYHYDEMFRGTIANIYVNFFKKSSDKMPYGYDANINMMRKWFFDAEWWEIYNFIEFLIENDNSEFFDRVSLFLEREKSGYRIINGQITPITDPVEVAAVSEAASAGDHFAGVRTHMQTAIQLYSKKLNPDYRNAIKEAISAVEAVARTITSNPKATLGDALKHMNDKMSLHPAMRDAMNKLYGYTSDEGGIRHAMLEESKIDDAEAKFMIVACSAFINFCIQRLA
jgi:hypothetical protein